MSSDKANYVLVAVNCSWSRSIKGECFLCDYSAMVLLLFLEIAFSKSLLELENANLVEHMPCYEHTVLNPGTTWKCYHTGRSFGAVTSLSESKSDLDQ